MSINTQIVLALHNADMHQNRLARIIGVAPNTVSRWVNGETTPKKDYLEAIATATGVTVKWLLAGENTPLWALAQRIAQDQPDAELMEASFSKALQLFTHNAKKGGAVATEIPVMGTAAGALAGSMAVSIEPTHHVRRPEILSQVPDAYALYVVGNSMANRYLPGDIIFVHPHKPYVAGDVVVIQTQNGNGSDVTAYLKVYGGQVDDEVIVKQYSNDDKIRFKKAHIKAIHRVMTVNEVYGA